MANFRILEVRNKQKVCRWCRTTRKKNHHSKAETIQKLKILSQLLQKYFFVKIFNFNLTGNVQSFQRVSEVRAIYHISVKDGIHHLADNLSFLKNGNPPISVFFVNKLLKRGDEFRFFPREYRNISTISFCLNWWLNRY